MSEGSVSGEAGGCESEDENSWLKNDPLPRRVVNSNLKAKVHWDLSHCISECVASALGLLLIERDLGAQADGWVTMERQGGMQEQPRHC